METEKVESPEEATVDDTGDSQEEVDQEEVDPMEKLNEVLSQGAELTELEAKLAEQRELIEQEEQTLRHSLAVGLVDGLFTELQGFASEFTQGVIYERYQGIQSHIAKIREHDPAFPRTLAESKYEVDTEHFQYWLGVLEKFIATGESLDKTLRGVYGTKIHGTPFESGD